MWLQGQAPPEEPLAIGGIHMMNIQSTYFSIYSLKRLNTRHSTDETTLSEIIPGKSSRPLQVALVSTHADQLASQKDADNLAQQVADQLQAKFGHVFDIHKQVCNDIIPYSKQ